MNAASLLWVILEDLNSNLSPPLIICKLFVTCCSYLKLFIKLQHFEIVVNFRVLIVLLGICFVKKNIFYMVNAFV